MRHRQWLAIGALVAGMVSAAVAPAAAQDCKIRRFGGPNRFSDPVESLTALQAMVSEHRGRSSRS